jgi:hypothetical protein
MSQSEVNKFYALVYYRNTICNLPTHDKTPYPSIGVISPEAFQNRKDSLTTIINWLFDGDDYRIFDPRKQSTHILHDEPAFIILSVNYPPKFPPTYTEFPSAYPQFFNDETGDRRQEKTAIADG